MGVFIRVLYRLAAHARWCNGVSFSDLRCTADLFVARYIFVDIATKTASLWTCNNSRDVDISVPFS